MKAVDYVVTEDFNASTGMTNYQREIFDRLSPERRPLLIQTKVMSRFGMRRLWRYTFFPAHVRRCRREGSILHLTSHFLGHIAKKPKRRPQVVTCLDLIPLEEGGYGPITSRLYQRSYAGMLQADHIVTISEHVRSRLEEALGWPSSRTTVVYPGVNAEIFKAGDKARARQSLGIDKNRFVVLYVGSEAPRKNFDFLLRAFRHVVRNEPGALLLKAGAAGTLGAREKHVALARKLSIQGSVRYLDVVPPDRLPALYRASDIFAFPSLSEGFGMPPLEAMACGVPVVASDRTSVPEVIGNAGMSVPVDDPKGFAEALLSLKDDPVRKRLFEERGPLRAREFSWESAARRLESTYEMFDLS